MLSEAIDPFSLLCQSRIFTFTLFDHNVRNNKKALVGLDLVWMYPRIENVKIHE